jgi:hypothetical protein
MESTQKRDGSNPHRGTDFNLKQGDEFILPFGGFVVESSTASGKNATFVVMLDVNGNQKNDDNVWLRVWHTKKKDNIAKNTYYAKGTAVGVVQDYNGDGSSNTKGDHLHFGVVFDSGTYEQYGPMYPYYLNVAYNDGKHLDLISYVNPTTSGLSFTAYIMDETKTDPQAPNDIVIFHKKSTETKWKRYNVPVNSTHNYYVTWSSLGYSIGQFTNIQYIIRVGRYSNVSDSGTQWTYYNWGFYPAKYERPDPDPDVSNDSPQPAYETYILL